MGKPCIICRTQGGCGVCDASQPAPADVVERYESWSDIQHDDKAIVACGERWKAVARSIGCNLFGFNDGNSATFVTPDGHHIEVGPKFRSQLSATLSKN